MVMKCVAVGCNNAKRKGVDIGFHTFPRQERVKAEWVARMKRGGGWKSTAVSRLCSEHFTPDSYEADFQLSRELGLPANKLTALTPTDHIILLISVMLMSSLTFT